MWAKPLIIKALYNDFQESIGGSLIETRPLELMGEGMRFFIQTDVAIIFNGM